MRIWRRSRNAEPNDSPLQLNGEKRANKVQTYNVRLETYNTFCYKRPMDEPHDRLQIARQNAGFENATDAARAFAWNENTYRSHENGERGLRLAIAERYAAAFETSAAWLLTGEGEDEARPEPKNIV
jgi:hypothetical protein